LAVIGKRDDLKFIEYLLRKIGREPSPAAAQNLKAAGIDHLAAERAKAVAAIGTTPRSTPWCGC